LNEADLRERLPNYRFYHIIPLTKDLATPGNPKHVPSQQPVLRALQALDLKGKRVLDLGCRDGLYSFTAERQGASEVVGIDNDLSDGAVELLIPYFKSSVRMYEQNLYAVSPKDFGTFDVILCAGLLYHLRYPVWGLKVIRELCRPKGILVLETAIFYGMAKHAMLYCPIGNEGPYGPTNCSFFNRKGLLDTLASLGWKTLSMSVLHPGEEARHANGSQPVIDRAVLVCEYAGANDSPLTQYWDGTHDLISKGGIEKLRGLCAGEPSNRTGEASPSR